MTDGLLAAPLGVEAQERKVPTIGLITVGAPETPWFPISPGPFWDRLRELGWVEGQTMVVVRRGAGGRFAQVPGIAAELAQLKVDAILADAGLTARRTQEGTRTIPICAFAGDLQAEGLVANLAKPESNITGVQSIQTDLVGKRLALLRELVPGLARVGVLINARSRETRSNTMVKILRAAEDAGRALGLELYVVDVAGPEDFDQAFSALAKDKVRGLVVVSAPMFYNNINPLVALVAKSRLIASYDIRDWVEAGGLMSYGRLESEVRRFWAECVDKILRGAKPAEVPMQQPTKFELVINLKTARALGLTIPPSLLQRADQVIE